MKDAVNLSQLIHLTLCYYIGDHCHVRDDWLFTLTHSLQQHSAMN